MKRSHFFALMFALAMLTCQAFAYASPSSMNAPDSVVATLSVSEQQEANFNAFVAWLNSHTSLKLNDRLQSAYQAVFAALKKNDYAAYVTQVNRLDAELAKLSVDATADMQRFFQTLSVETGLKVITDLKVIEEGGSCEVSCLFGSCSIECPSGTKPKCFCSGGNPHCGCEPYSR
jgi:hypothetical protein